MSYSTSALLKMYGSKAVNVTEVVRHFYPDAPRPNPADDLDLKIGTEYVPPLGGISIIDPTRVVKRGYADKLKQAGYSPQAIQGDRKEQKNNLAETTVLSLVFVTLVSAAIVFIAVL